MCFVFLYFLFVDLIVFFFVLYEVVIVLVVCCVLILFDVFFKLFIMIFCFLVEFDNVIIV